MNKEPLVKAIQIAGGQTALAKKIGGGIKQGHVWWWLNRSKSGVPPEYAAAIEKATGGAVTRQDLCPNVFKEKPEHAA